MNILCPTCKKNDKVEVYESLGKPVVYCRRCEEGCVPALVVEENEKDKQNEEDNKNMSATPRTDAKKMKLREGEDLSIYDKND